MLFSKKIRFFYHPLLRAISSFLAFSQKVLIFQRNGLCIQYSFNITEKISEVFVTCDNPFNGQWSSSIQPIMTVVRLIIQYFYKSVTKKIFQTDNSFQSF